MTTTAVLMCLGCEGWQRHAFVRREPIVSKGGDVRGANLIFSCPTGHQRVWGNEGPADARREAT